MVRGVPVALPQVFLGVTLMLPPVVPAVTVMLLEVCGAGDVIVQSDGTDHV
jgi:hypothetical protein